MITCVYLPPSLSALSMSHALASQEAVISFPLSSGRWLAIQEVVFLPAFPASFSQSSNSCFFLRRRSLQVDSKRSHIYDFFLASIWRAAATWYLLVMQYIFANSHKMIQECTQLANVYQNYQYAFLL